MQHQTNSNLTSVRWFGLPLAVWVAIASVAAALAAIFIFNVAMDKVLLAGLVGLMLFSHLFMHGGHGSHGSHSGSTTPPEEGNGEPKSKHTGHTGGCH